MAEPKDDVSRRDLVMKLLGAAAGGVALQALTGCVAQAGEPESLGQTHQELIGTSALVWVDTISDLKAVSGQGVANNKTSTVVVLGYAARGDGGGGVFVWTKITPQPA
ncbi:MAG: hypothetical protein U0263_41665, partial [Polyangiaceae bacterium]